jgi:2-C-methyl-D-erythritol 2,4-cyclodiphosphate synthase
VRIGQGVDVHAFQDGGTLVLGGVAIPYERSLEAHSDGDVVLHALCDALLGAAALGDIGRHFPPTDATYENIDSRKLLRKTHEQLLTRYFKVVNVDVTIVAQAPKLSAYVDAMCENISADLQIKVSRVNVKATTSEYLGFAGRGEGIAALAVVLIESR